MSTFEEILSAALALPPEMRAILADHLLTSLDGEDQRRIDALWAEEAERRVRAIDEGRVETIDGELVMRELRARRQSGRELMLQDLLAGVTKQNRHPEVDFGHPVGKEKL